MEGKLKKERKIEDKRVIKKHTKTAPILLKKIVNGVRDKTRGSERGPERGPDWRGAADDVRDVS